MYSIVERQEFCITVERCNSNLKPLLGGYFMQLIRRSFVVTKTLNYREHLDELVQNVCQFLLLPDERPAALFSSMNFPNVQLCFGELFQVVTAYIIHNSPGNPFLQELCVVLRIARAYLRRKSKINRRTPVESSLMYFSVYSM